jgi:pentatricopeptide repeat protein
MVAAGVTPNALTWRTLVEGWAKKGHLEGARDAQQRMEAAGVKRDDIARTYTSKMMSAWGGGALGCGRAVSPCGTR